MPEAPLADAEERASVVAAFDAFAAEWSDNPGLLSLEHRAITDRTATDRWVLRFSGTEKDVIAIWLTLGQRTVVAEAELMAAPDEHADVVHALLLARNASLFGLAYAIGPEQGLYLMARAPAATFDAAELDRLCGGIVSELDEVYPTAMSLAYPGRFRRRRRA